MVTPVMIAVFCEGLRAVPRGWLEGSLALGVNRWRTFWKIAVRSARPALIAGTVLGTARALGESVMLLMVSGGVGFSPNPADGLIFFVEPSRGLSATILQYKDDLTSPAMRATLYSVAAVLLFSAAMLSLIGRAAKLPMPPLRLHRGGGAVSAIARNTGLEPPTPSGGPRRRESSASWRLRDRLGLAFAWFLGLLFCAIVAAIVIYLAVQGIQYLRPSMLCHQPAGRCQSEPDAAASWTRCSAR